MLLEQAGQIGPLRLKNRVVMSATGALIFLGAASRAASLGR